jgi:hypothetical protein
MLQLRAGKCLPAGRNGARQPEGHNRLGILARARDADAKAMARSRRTLWEMALLTTLCLGGIGFFMIRASHFEETLLECSFLLEAEVLHRTDAEKVARQLNMELLAGHFTAMVQAADQVKVLDGTGPESLVLEVLETGQGIHPDLVPRIFEPFFTTKPPSPKAKARASVWRWSMESSRPTEARSNASARRGRAPGSG